ncbi:phosphomannomutase [Rhodoferax fermentans]|uniref:Phosphomannomutase n=1 Tax=Rhodoferax fermentans TaxID=28066 RepID=A0A1T1AUG9_RHOFE|nr:phosphomannomutase [Rhodoferax fermentans]MBK1682905.1 phosphomannomutase [Rhodoferax fermentans]OOV07756.1 phosphomannomutase [Rhodoferax fermentans]
MNSNNFADRVARSGVAFGTSGARGLVADMTDELCYAYASAFLQTVARGASTLVLGHDLRPSSPRMAAACAAAAAAHGARVIYAGALPTPALAYYAAQLRVPALVITGSHIPFDRNGIKFYRADGEISKADEQAMLAATVELPTSLGLAALPEPDAQVAQAYVQRYTQFFGSQALAGMRVAVYEHSSVGRDIIGQILQALGAQVLPLGRTDVFVPIDTEAVRPEDIAQARAWAAEHRFDAILSTDGDADRPLLGDERGQWLRGDVVGILCAQFLRAQVVVTPVSSNTALEKSGAFAQVLRTRIGSPYVIAGMDTALAAQAQNAALQAGPVVGFEANGGFLLASDVMQHGRQLAALPTRDAVLPMLALLSLARQRGCQLSDLSVDLPKRFTASDRLQAFATDKSRTLIQNLLADVVQMAATLAPGAGAVAEVDQTDGLRVTFANQDIVHLRPSGNAPELRCYAESATEAAAKALCDDCLARIGQL